MIGAESGCLVAPMQDQLAYVSTRSPRCHLNLTHRQHNAHGPGSAIGNEHDWGKVLLGTATDQRQLRGALNLGGLCTALPAASLRYPHLLEELADQPQGDCAGDMRDGLQSLMINQAMAAIAAQYLHQLVSTRRISTFETALDLANLTMTSTPITAAALAEASGLTVAEIALTDEPNHQRTRGHP